MLLDLGTLDLAYASIALEKSNAPFSDDGALFNNSLARTVASSMENPAPVICQLLPCNFHLLFHEKLTRKYDERGCTLTTRWQHHP